MRLEDHFKSKNGMVPFHWRTIYADERADLGLPVAPLEAAVWFYLFHRASEHYHGATVSEVARKVWGSPNNRKTAQRILSRLEESNHASVDGEGRWHATMPERTRVAKNQHSEQGESNDSHKAAKKEACGEGESFDSPQDARQRKGGESNDSSSKRAPESNDSPIVSNSKSSSHGESNDSPSFEHLSQMTHPPESNDSPPESNDSPPSIETGETERDISPPTPPCDREDEFERGGDFSEAIGQTGLGVGSCRRHPPEAAGSPSRALGCERRPAETIALENAPGTLLERQNRPRVETVELWIPDVKPRNKRLVWEGVKPISPRYPFRVPDDEDKRALFFDTAVKASMACYVFGRGEAIASKAAWTRHRRQAFVDDPREAIAVLEEWLELQPSALEQRAKALRPPPVKLSMPSVSEKDGSALSSLDWLIERHDKAMAAYQELAGVLGDGDAKRFLKPYDNALSKIDPNNLAEARKVRRRLLKAIEQQHRERCGGDE